MQIPNSRVLSLRFTAVQDTLARTVFDGRYHFIGFGGAIRGTKTWGGLGMLVTLCRIFPRSRWAVVRKDLPTLRRNTIPSFGKLRETCDGFVGEINQSTWTAPCANGSEILFFPESAQEDPELLRWRGLEVNGFLLEEADELQEASFVKAIERAGAWVVPNGEQPPPLVICTFNPTAGWPKRVFYEPWRNGTIAAPYAFIPSTMADNPFVSDAYRESLKAMPEQEYKRFVEGDWDTLTGRYYDELDGRIHFKSRPKLPQPFPDWWEAFGSYDWGYAHWATFGLWVKDADGTPHLIDTLWLRRHQDPAQAREIVRFANDHGLSRALNAVYAGRDAFNKVTAHGASGLSTADVFLDHGIHLARADDDKVNGGRAVRRALHVTTAEDGTQRAGVYLIDTQGNRRVFEQLAETMPDPNDINKPLKVDADSEGRGGDDGADMFRNGLSTQIPESEEPRPTYRDFSNVANGKGPPAPWELPENEYRMSDEDGVIDRRIWVNRPSLHPGDQQFFPEDW